MHCTEIWPGSGSHARTAGSHHRELGSYFVTRAGGQGWALRTKLYIGLLPRTPWITQRDSRLQQPRL